MVSDERWKRRLPRKVILWSPNGRCGSANAARSVAEFTATLAFPLYVSHQSRPLSLDPETTELRGAKGVRASADMQIDMGPRLCFVGRGSEYCIDTGTMRMPDE